jgi:Histone methylation protein DOT1
LEAYLLNADNATEIHLRAKAIYTRLEAANFELYRAIRRGIQQGAGPDILLHWAHQSGLAKGEGYDYLDELIIGLLQFEEPAPEVVPLGAEMVPYQPTPARHIFDLISRTALTDRDVLIDLGSGLGHVPLLASICTSARSIGIELESAYTYCARRSAQGLNLNNVTFLQQDARTADLSVGTVFYLYTPFTGTILRAVLDSLRREAASRQIRICTFGPCTPTIAREEWLQAIGPIDTDRVAIFCSLKVN